MEQRNWKIIKTIAFSISVLIVLFWVRNTIIDEFSRISKKGILDLSYSIADRFSVDEEELEENIYFFRYDEDFRPVFAIDDDKVQFIKSQPFFDYAVEHVLYEESYFHEKILYLFGKPVYIVFQPVIRDYEVIGGVVCFLSADDHNKFLNIVNILFLIVFALALIVFSVSQFSKDPVSVYAILVTIAVVLVFIVYPLYEAVKITFARTGVFTFDVWKKVLTEKNYLEALTGSITLGILTATVATVVGFIFAFTVTRTYVRGKKFIHTIALLPVISPPFSLTLSIILLFGSNGLITKQLLNMKADIYGLHGLVLVQTLGMFPIAYLTLLGVLESIDSSLEEASMNLNGNRLKTFLNVTLPLALPGMASAWLLVFTNSIADFANPLLLSGKFKVLSVTAYLEVTGMNRIDIGAALSLLLLLPALTAFYIQRYVISKKSFVTITGKPSVRLIEVVNRPMKIILQIFVYASIAFIIGLYATIFAGAFVKNWGIDYTFTLENIVEALQRGKKALADTTILATVAMPIAGIFSMIVAVIFVRKRFLGKKIFEGLVLLPFAIPGTLLGISYVIAFNKPPIILVGTAAIIVINYIIRELPVGVENGVAVLRQVDPTIEEAAQNLGADTQTVFRTIILPLLRPAFISSLSYTFVRAMTAVSAVIFLISARWYHLTILIYNFSENLRFGLASVLSSVLIIIVLTVFGLLNFLIKRNENLERSGTMVGR